MGVGLDALMTCVVFLLVFWVLMSLVLVLACVAGRRG